MFKKLGLKKFFIKIRFTKLGLKEISGKKFCQNNFPEKIFRKKRFPKFGEKNLRRREKTAEFHKKRVPVRRSYTTQIVEYMKLSFSIQIIAMNIEVQINYTSVIVQATTPHDTICL